VAALRVRIKIEPGHSESVSFISGFAKSKDDCGALAQRYREQHRVARAFEMAWSQASVELRNEQAAARSAHIFQQLGNALLFQH